MKARTEQWAMLSFISRDLKLVIDWKRSVITWPHQYETQVPHCLTNHVILFSFASLKVQQDLKASIWLPGNWQYSPQQPR